jgi:hypothetical protein
MRIMAYPMTAWTVGRHPDQRRVWSGCPNRFPQCFQWWSGWSAWSGYLNLSPAWGLVTGIRSPSRAHVSDIPGPPGPRKENQWLRRHPARTTTRTTRTTAPASIVRPVQVTPRPPAALTVARKTTRLCEAPVPHLALWSLWLFSSARARVLAKELGGPLGTTGLSPAEGAATAYTSLSLSQVGSTVHAVRSRKRRSVPASRCSRNRETSVLLVLSFNPLRGPFGPSADGPAYYAVC